MTEMCKEGWTLRMDYLVNPTQLNREIYIAHVKSCEQCAAYYVELAAWNAEYPEPADEHA